MGAVGGLLGVGGGVNGTGISGPTSANILQPTTSKQAEDQYAQAQAALQQQNNFLQATQAQNGLANQSNVYGQLANVAAGQGPNPAKAMLANATGANVANQAALMAGQRGAGQNVGLIARQAAQQGANTQQQSAGQAAQLQAQQSLNALSGMGTLAQQQVAQQQAATNAYTTGTQNEQQNILNAIAGQNNANVGMASNINNVNGQLANTTMQGQQALIGGLMNGGAASSMMSSLAKGGVVPGYDEGGEIDYKDSGDEGASAAPNTSTPSFGGDSGAAALSGKGSGGGSGGGGIMKLAALAAKGGKVDSSMPKAEATPNFGNPGANALYQGMAGSGGYKGLSNFGHFISNMFTSAPKTNPSEDYYGVKGDTPIETESENAAGQMRADQMKTQQGPQTTQDVNPNQFMAAKGGKVPAMVSPGEVYLDRKAVNEVAKGKDPIHAGEKIPGKAKVKGNSYANDTVPKTLESGGIVLPKSVMEAKHPHWEAHKFVSQILAKNGKLPPRKK